MISTWKLCGRKDSGSPPGGRGYGLEVHPARLDEVPEHIGPVVAGIPGDAGRRVNLYGHDLADLTTLDEDYGTTDAAALAATILSPEDVLADEWVVVSHVCPGDNMSGLDGESGNDVRDVLRRQKAGGGAYLRRESGDVGR